MEDAIEKKIQNTIAQNNHEIKKVKKELKYIEDLRKQINLNAGSSAALIAYANNSAEFIQAESMLKEMGFDLPSLSEEKPKKKIAIEKGKKSRRLHI